MNEALRKLLLYGTLIAICLFCANNILANDNQLNGMNEKSLKSFVFDSKDYPNHPLWDGLDATIIEIPQNTRASLFKTELRQGKEWRKAAARFSLCCVSAVAEQRGVKHVTFTEDEEGDALVIFHEKDENYKKYVPDQYVNFEFDVFVNIVDSWGKMCGFSL